MLCTRCAFPFTLHRLTLRQYSVLPEGSTNRTQKRKREEEKDTSTISVWEPEEKEELPSDDTASTRGRTDNHLELLSPRPNSRRSSTNIEWYRAPRRHRTSRTTASSSSGSRSEGGGERKSDVFRHAFERFVSLDVDPEPSPTANPPQEHPDPENHDKSRQWLKLKPWIGREMIPTLQTLKLLRDPEHQKALRRIRDKEREAKRKWRKRVDMNNLFLRASRTLPGFREPFNPAPPLRETFAIGIQLPRLLTSPPALNLAMWDPNDRWSHRIARIDRVDRALQYSTNTDTKPKFKKVIAYFIKKEDAEDAVKNGFLFEGKRYDAWWPDKQSVKQCMRCQQLNHLLEDCKSQHPVCPFCSKPHSASECNLTRKIKTGFTCALCGGDHPSFRSSKCPVWWQHRVASKAALSSELAVDTQSHEYHEES
ncbi:hypothetical protein BT69DRAFT_1287335 [Atractiella rhizophila]|nr:hypothetical protein BT69DRAFT_1287335 [Atractiella rhizophila]